MGNIRAVCCVLFAGMMAWQALPQAEAQQAKTQFIINGVPATGGNIQISDEQKLMLEAAKKVVNNDYQGAAALYDQAISMNGSNIDAYLQRGIVRRELGDQQGAAADGRAVVTMANNSLKMAPNDASLYHRRGMGLRLLRDFENARADIMHAMQLSGQMSWKTDLQAIELEQKAFQ